MPRLSEGLAVARRLVGDREASRLVTERPTAVLNNLSPQGFGLTHKDAGQAKARPSMIDSWFGQRHRVP
ncbi:hypothetical protein D3C72_2262430 [compost metagenome]